MTIFAKTKTFLSTKKIAVFFSISATFYSISLMLSNILVMRWISPEDIGVWNTLFVFQSYAFFLQLGILNGLNRDLPFYYGKGNPNKAKQLASSALWVVKFIVGITSAIVFISMIIIYYKTSYSFNIKSTILTVGVLTVIFFYQNYLIVTFRTNKAFDKLAKIYLLNGVIIIVSLLLVWKYLYFGYLIRALLLSTSLTLLLHIYRPLKSIRPIYDYLSVKELIATGLPLFSAGYIGGIAQTVNRWVLLKYAGVVFVGYYSPALAILIVMKMFPQQIGQYLYPQMSYEVGKTNDREKLWRWVWKSALGLIFLLTPIGLVGWFLLPPFIESLFPEYSRGIFAAQIAIISGILSGSLIGINVLNSLKAFKAIAYLNTSKLTMNIVFMIIGVQFKEPLTGVAFGLVISDLIYFVIALITCKVKLLRQ